MAEMKKGEEIFSDKSRGGPTVRLLVSDMSIDRGAMVRALGIGFLLESVMYSTYPL